MGLTSLTLPLLGAARGGPNRNTCKWRKNPDPEDERRRGGPLQARKRFSPIEEASTPALNSGIMEPAEKLVISGGLPASAAADAIHIAVATVYQIDYLATWNIRHIANAQIRRITKGILEDTGYRRPIVCTPEELFGVDDLEG